MHGARLEKNIDMETFEASLEGIIQILEDKSLPLSESDIEIVFQDLENIVNKNRRNIVRLINKYSGLPDYLIPNLLKRTWKKLRDDDKIAVMQLLTDKLPNTSGIGAQALRLKTGAALLSEEPQETRRLISFSFKKSLTGPNHVPSRNFCSLFRNEFISPDGFPLDKVPCPVPVSDQQLWGICALRSCITVNKKNVPSCLPDVLCRIVEWASRKALKIEVPPYLQNEISLCVENWPDRMKDKADWVLQQLGIQRQVIKPDSAGEKKFEDKVGHQKCADSVPQIVPVSPPQPIAITEPQQLNSLRLKEAISRVSYYSSVLETDLRDRIAILEKELQENQVAVLDYQEKLRNTGESLERLKKSCEEQSNKITRLRNEITKITGEKQAKDSQITQLQSKLGQVDHRWQEATKSNRELTQKNEYLEERVTAEATYQVEVLKNQIARELKMEFVQMKSLDSLAPTPNMAVGLRSEIKTIFSKLRYLGINFEGSDNG